MSPYKTIVDEQEKLISKKFSIQNTINTNKQLTELDNEEKEDKDNEFENNVCAECGFFHYRVNPICMIENTEKEVIEFEEYISELYRIDDYIALIGHVNISKMKDERDKNHCPCDKCWHHYLMIQVSDEYDFEYIGMGCSKYT